MNVSQLRRISVSELNDKPGEILDRAMRGERFVVCRHRRPIAMLLPLGASPGDLLTDLDELTEGEKMVLRDSVRQGALKWAGVDTKNLVLRGLARRSPSRGGLVITGRGLILREELLARAGVDPTDCWIGGRA